MTVELLQNKQMLTADLLEIPLKEKGELEICCMNMRLKKTNKFLGQ